MWRKWKETWKSRCSTMYNLHVHDKNQFITIWFLDYHFLSIQNNTSLFPPFWEKVKTWIIWIKESQIRNKSEFNNEREMKLIVISEIKSKEMPIVPAVLIILRMNSFIHLLKSLEAKAEVTYECTWSSFEMTNVTEAKTLQSMLKSKI